jgi:hypothetical protein
MPSASVSSSTSKNGAQVVVNPLSAATALASPPSPVISPLNSSPSSNPRPRKTIAGFLGYEGQTRKDSALDGVPEPEWGQDPVVSKFADETARKPVRFTIDMLLAVGPSLLALYSVYDSESTTGLRNVYFDGCNLSASAASNTSLHLNTTIPILDCISCNGNSPRFSVSFPETVKPLLVAFSILSSIFLAGATYGLNVLRDRAIRYLQYGVYISSTARSNKLSAIFVSLYVIILAVLQVVAQEQRQNDFESKTLTCTNAASPYFGLPLTPTFKSGNITVPMPLVSAASISALIASLFYFLLNTVLSQAFTIRSICEGPSNLYTDASLRTALKKQHTVRRIQDVLKWQVLAIDLDTASKKALRELSITERPKRQWTILRLVFAPLIIIDYFGTYSSYIGVHPFDRTFRKKEWQGRTMVEEILHRLWQQGKITKFRVRDKEVLVEAGEKDSSKKPSDATVSIVPLGAGPGDEDDDEDFTPLEETETPSTSSSEVPTGSASPGHAQGGAVSRAAVVGLEQEGDVEVNAKK